MSLAEDIKTSLSAGVSAVGSRVYPEAFPLGVAYPCVTYQKVGRTYTHSAGHGVVERVSHYQIDGWDLTADGAESVGDAVEAVLIALTSGTVAIYGVTIENRFATHEPGDALYRETLDTLLVHA